MVANDAELAKLEEHAYLKSTVTNLELAADAYLESKGTNSELAKLDHAYLTSEGTNSEELAKLEDHAYPTSTFPVALVYTTVIPKASPTKTSIPKAMPLIFKAMPPTKKHGRLSVQ